MGYFVLAVKCISSGPQLLLKPPTPVRCCVNVIVPVAVFAVLNLPATAVVVTVVVLPPLVFTYVDLASLTEKWPFVETGIVPTLMIAAALAYGLPEMAPPGIHPILPYRNPSRLVP